LRTVGTVLQEEIRSSDVACRLGGEEFLVILPRASLDVARRKSDALHAALRSIELSHGGRRLPPVTFSAGAAVFPEDGATADALLRSADAALYQAKKAGRDRTASASSDRAALRSRA
jgi:diguanylate cyclase (GGDEF)-like protein